jgi:hypothetical protein
VAKDVPPFLKAVGNPVKLYGLNSVGLQRSGFDETVIRELKRAYRLFFRSELNVSQARAKAATELTLSPEVDHSCASSRTATGGSSSEQGDTDWRGRAPGALGYHHVRILRELEGGRVSSGSTTSAPNARTR